MLCADNFSCVTVNAGDDALPVADARCRLSSLPFLLGTRVDNVPPTPYLSASVQRRGFWREKLRALPSPRIGMTWAGNPNFRLDAKRSMDVETIRPLVEGREKHFVSLQKEKKEAVGFFDAMDDIDNFADTAALIAELDLVVTVDTAIAHLAGALGKPVWVMLPFISDWRWLLGRMDSPWYKNTRLFRQKKPDEWGSVVNPVANEIQRLIAGNREVLKPVIWYGGNLRRNPDALPLPS